MRKKCFIFFYKIKERPVHSALLSIGLGLCLSLNIIAALIFITFENYLKALIALEMLAMELLIVSIIVLFILICDLKNKGVLLWHRNSIG